MPASDLRPGIELLQPYLWPMLIALAVTVIVTPIVRAIAVAGGIYDTPDGGLKPHQKPVPYLGGVAIYLGWAAGLASMLLFAPPGLVSPGARSMLGYILSGGTVMMLIGLVDDLYDIRPTTKLLCTLIVAAVLVHGGIGRHILLVFVGWSGVHPPAWLMWTSFAVLASLIVMGAGNATNLIDGLDGLCSGVTGIISIGFAVIAAHLAVWRTSVDGDPVRLTVALSLLGACLGFLRYNFNPAQVFMGDAGSLLLGFNAAVMLLLFAERGILRWFLGASMVFALPVFDTALAISRRLLNGRPIFKGDRSHFYDQLCDRGFTVKQTVLVCYALAAGLAGLGCLVIFFRTRITGLVFLTVVLAAVLTVIRLGMLRVDPSREPRAD